MEEYEIESDETSLSLLFPQQIGFVVFCMFC